MSGFVAVDLGAASGRVMLADVGPDRLELTELQRFPNVPVTVSGTLYWNVLGLYQEVLAGLSVAAARGARPVSVGIDSWAVDYGLLDDSGTLLGTPVHYRDGRTESAVPRVLERVPAERLYSRTGLQVLPINTLYQLMSERDSARMAAASGLLLIPDLLSYWLTGVAGTERTNASTTQLIDIRSGRWATDLLAELDIRPELFGSLRDPGTDAGTLLPEVVAEAGLPSTTRVTAVGSHDTASAVAAVPADGDGFGYISCGTWSLVGVELAEPVLSQESRRANFTNERGVDGTIRYLRNVMGLWLLQESIRTWRASGLDVEVTDLLRQAAMLPARRFLVDPADPAFLPPGDMPSRIARECARAGGPVPQTPAEVTRCVLDSLAEAHRRTLAEAQRLSGKSIQVVHVVGGGARNDLLCQLTADACGLPVVAGPVEATAIGNALVQARAAGVLSGGLSDLRRLIRRTQVLRHYQPGAGN